MNDLPVWSGFYIQIVGFEYKNRLDWIAVYTIVFAMRCCLIFLLFASSTSAEILRVPGDHPSIQAALEVASPGTMVKVEPGTYKERIVLTPGVILQSLKGAEMTIIDGSAGPAERAGVTMAENATLIGFTVTGVGRYDDEKWQMSWKSQGEGQDHDHIGEFGTPAIAVEDVTCRVISNVVHHNGFTGIAIRGSNAFPVVEHNTCYRNMGGGIGVMQRAGGQIQYNTCYENFFAGIGHDNSSPGVVSNTCYGNIRAGIGISEGATPLVRDNRCYRNRRAGIGIRTGVSTHPRVIGNHCFENGMAGIGVKDDARAWIEKNVCYSNKLAGIGARAGAIIHVHENKSYGNKASGIGLGVGGGEATITGNVISSNQTVEVGIQSGWNVKLEGNDLKGGSGLPPVVMAFEDTKVMLSENRIAGRGVAGVRVAGDVFIENNHFDGLSIRKGGPPHFGVWALEGAKVRVVNNRFTRWRHGMVANGAEVVFDRNMITDFHQHAVLVDGKPKDSW